jgi:hypothetical protein
MARREQQPSDPRQSEASGLRQYFAELGSGARWLIGALVTALIAWAVPTYVPRLFDDDSGDSRPPLAAQVNADPARIDVLSDAPQYAVLRRFSRENRPPGRGCDGFHAWVRDQGGASLRETPMRLTLRGQAREPVLVTGIRARVLDRARPSYPIRVTCPSAGQVEVRAAALRLDSPSPVATLVEDGRQRPLALTLRRGEAELVDVTATARRSAATWVLLVDYTAGGEKHTLALRDGGRPFQTAPAAARTDTQSYVWDWSREVWSRERP